MCAPPISLVAMRYAATTADPSPRRPVCTGGLAPLRTPSLVDVETIDGGGQILRRGAEEPQGQVARILYALVAAL